MALAIRHIPCRVKGFKALVHQLKYCIAQSSFDCTLANIPLGDRCGLFCTNNTTHIYVNLSFFLFLFPLRQSIQNMSFSSSVFSIYSIALAIAQALKCQSLYRTAPQELKLLLLEVTSLSTMLPHEQRLSSDSEAPLQGISFLEPAVLDWNTKLEQALEVLKRGCDSTSKGGSRFKDRHKGWGWQETKIVREQLDGFRETMERLRMEMDRKQIDGVREGTQRLRKDLRSHTSKSPIPAEERAHYLFILQSDHQCNPITNSMRNTCTAIISAPNRLNINMSINKGFSDNSVKSTLNGGPFPIQVAETKYNHQIYDFNQAFPQLESEQTLHQALLKRMFQIASALVRLHEEPHLFGELDRYLAHSDLKPENILLVHHNHAGTSASHHPAGKWRLTDFGVSVFDKATTCLTTLHRTGDPHRDFFKQRLTTRNTAHSRSVSDAPTSSYPSSLNEVSPDGPRSSPLASTGHPHGCPICQKDRTFGTCDGWKRHMKEHETLYPCNMCAASGKIRSYSRKLNLQRHLETHGLSNNSSSTLADKWKKTHEKRFFGCGFCVFLCNSHLKRPCWEPEANSESRTCPQHPTSPNSKLEHFLHRIRKALPLKISSLVVLLSPLFFAPSVGALAPGCVSTHDRVSWVQAFRSTQTNLISVSPS